MKRLFALGLALSLLQSSVAFAAGPLSLAAGSTQATKTEKVQSSAPLKLTSFAEAARVGASPAQQSGTLAQQGAGGTISQSGMSKGMKTLIFAAVGAGFVGIAYGIDHKVKDVTPSSLGQRHDEDVFKK